jgi:NAD(P)-dependent dehydrogenase (short-subunit alcohol dehydrogenase family)
VRAQKILGDILKIPMGRIGVPDDIAGIALFLASDDASWISADTLFVDGGALDHALSKYLQNSHG